MASTLTVVEVTEPAQYDPLQLNPAAPFTQAWFYGEWQERIGHSVKRFAIKNGPRPVGYLQAVNYQIRAKNYWYLPYGPVLEAFDGAVVPALAHWVQQLATAETFFVRFDFTATQAVSNTELTSLEKPWQAVKNVETASSLQPRSEWLLNIDLDERRLMQQMQYDGRRAIRIGNEHGLQSHIVKTNLMSHFDEFMRMQRLTAERNNIALHPDNYYRTMFETAERDHNGYLVLASRKNQPMSASFIITYGDTATYIFGGSDENFGKLRPTYVAQWAAIEEAQRRGAKLYNFGGIYSSLYPRRSLKGISVFKKKFGGYQVDHPYAYDYVLQPGWYRAYMVYKSLQKLVRR